MKPRIIPAICAGMGLVTAGCITTEESYQNTRDPYYSQEVENELKTEEDWENWRKLQKHNKNASMIIE